MMKNWVIMKNITQALKSMLGSGKLIDEVLRRRMLRNWPKDRSRNFQDPI